jgi:hypothetical protein
MFALLSGTIDHAQRREHEAVTSAVRANREHAARLDHELTVLVRRAEDNGAWRAAGCSSSAAWVAQITNSSYRSAELVTTASSALRDAPAIDQAMSEGALNLEQGAAVLKHATPETDAELARMALGKQPSRIALEARKLNPPTLADDHAIYKRRALRMAWTDGRSELVFSGCLPPELGVIFEHAIWEAAKAQRAEDKKHGVVLDWQQSTADALITLATRDEVRSGGGVRRSRVTTVVHLSPDEPPIIEGAGPISPETAEHLTCNSRLVSIKPHGSDLMHTRMRRDTSWAQLRALFKRAGGQCQYPACSATHELEAHHMIPVARGGKTELANLVLLCQRHHKRLHDYRLRMTGKAEQPAFRDGDGRLITANQPHAPPA